MSEFQVENVLKYYLKGKQIISVQERKPQFMECFSETTKFTGIYKDTMKIVINLQDYLFLRKVPGIWKGLWNSIFLLKDFYPREFVKEVCRELILQWRGKRESHAHQVLRGQCENGLRLLKGPW